MVLSLTMKNSRNYRREPHDTMVQYPLLIGENCKERVTYTVNSIGHDQFTARIDSKD